MITSVSNPHIKRIVQLQEKSKVRNQEDVFVIEGSKLFSEAPAHMIREIYLSEEFADQCRQSEIKDRWKQFSHETVSREVFLKISRTQTPQGILCILRQPHYTLDDFQSENPFFLLLEDIQDPGNLGTMLRTGEGAGVTGVILNRGCVDIFNPKTIRATMGSVFRIPFLYQERLDDIVVYLQEQGIRVYASHMEGTVFYTENDYAQGTAIIIGNEGKGLSEKTAGSADQKIRIPMEGQLESLNAAAAAAIILYEVHRQRT